MSPQPGLASPLLGGLSWGLGVLSLEGIDVVPEIDLRDSNIFTIENMNWKKSCP